MRGAGRSGSGARYGSGGRGGPKADHLDALALRVWRLDRQAVRFVLGELGVPVVSWDGVDPLDLALAPLARTQLAGRVR
ncbi:hypothetical protein ACFQ9X_36925 [Catenulispora yoronensis]